MIRRVQLLIAPLAALLWIFLALLSRLDLSGLQLNWNLKSSIAIFLYFPLCITSGCLGVKISKSNDIITEDKSNFYINILFFLVMSLFLLQWIIQLPPIFSLDPSEARLTWGFKYVHMATEIIIRTTMILTVASIIVRKKISKIDLLIIFSSLFYAFCVVSRGLIMEMFFYLVVASFLIGQQKEKFRTTLLYLLFFTFLGLVFFVLYGQWRQGDQFSIVVYGQLKYNNPALAWFFGYFLVNFDNLALVIMKDYQNFSLTNVFGPLLQSLQIAKYLDIDNYIYVGAFNLGTEFRPYVLDYGTWIGGAVFAFIWSVCLASPAYCVSLKGRWAILLLLLYVGISLPMTSRLLNPPYLFSLILVIVFDNIKFSFIQRRLGLKNV